MVSLYYNLFSISYKSTRSGSLNCPGSPARSFASGLWPPDLFGIKNAALTGMERRINLVGFICFQPILFFLNLSTETHTLMPLFLLSHG